MVNINFGRDMTKEPKDDLEVVENARDRISGEDYESMTSDILNGSVKDFIEKLNVASDSSMIMEGGDFIEDLIDQLVELTLIQNIIDKDQQAEDDEFDPRDYVPEGEK